MLPTVLVHSPSLNPLLQVASSCMSSPYFFAYFVCIYSTVHRSAALVCILLCLVISVTCQYNETQQYVSFSFVLFSRAGSLHRLFLL